MEETIPLSMNHQAIKVKSIWELYLLLIDDWRMYMSPKQDFNVRYVGGVVTGSLKVEFTNDKNKL